METTKASVDNSQEDVKTGNGESGAVSNGQPDPTKDKDVEKRKERRRLGFAILIVAVVIILFLLSMLIALLVIDYQKHTCLEREAERNRIENTTPEQESFGEHSTQLPESTTEMSLIIKAFPLIGAEGEDPEFNETLIEEHGKLTQIAVAWKSNGPVTGLQLNYESGTEFHGGTKVDSYIIADNEEIQRFDFWEDTGRMTGFQFYAKNSAGQERTIGPFGDITTWPHKNKTLPGQFLFFSGLWDDQRIINIYFHYSCKRPVINGTGLVDRVCEMSAVGNPSGSLTNTFNDQNFSKNGRISAIKVIHGEYVNAMEVTYGNVIATHGEWRSAVVPIQPDDKVAEISIWFGAILSAVSFTIEDSSRRRINFGPYGTFERNEDIQETYGITNLIRSLIAFKENEILVHLTSISNADGLISALQIYYSTTSSGDPLALNASELCDTEKIVPIVIYRGPATNTSQAASEDRTFNDYLHRLLGGQISNVEVVSNMGTFGIRMKYGNLMAPAHGEASRGTRSFSFKLDPGEFIYAVSLWRAPSPSLPGLGEEYEGNIKGMTFYVRSGLDSRIHGPYGSQEGNLTSLYFGKLEYISGLTGDVYQAPLQLSFHYKCEALECVL